MDLYAAAHALVSARSPAAYPLALVFGVVSSLGPCAVTRYTAIARSSAVASRPWRAIGVFVAGIVVMYALFGAASAILAFTQALAAVLYGAMALVFVIWGVRMALNVHDHAGEACETVPAPARPSTTSSTLGIFVLGVASACTISPCCAPFLGLTVAVAAQSHDPIFGAAVLSIFAVGHAVPLLGYGAAGSYLMSLGERTPLLRDVVAIAFSALMIGTGITYALQV